LYWHTRPEAEVGMRMEEPFRSPAFNAFKARVEENTILGSLFLMLSVRFRIFLQSSGESTKTFGLPEPVTSDNPEHRRMLEQHIENFELAWNRLLENRSDSEVRDAHDRFLHEVLVTRTVDALEAYLGTMFAYIFATQPEHLTDEDRQELDGLIGEDRTAKIEELAERRAGNLTGGGMDAIIKYLNNKMHVLISAKGDDLYRQANECINVRHLIVHTDLKVTTTFLRRTQRQDLHKGQTFPLTHDYATNAVRTLWDFVIGLDTILVERLNLFLDERAPSDPATNAVLTASAADTRLQPSG
jgi:hypothetical protein